MDHLAHDPQPNQFFALGVPVRLIFEAKVDISGVSLVSDFSKKVRKGEFISYNLEFSKNNGKFYYLADAFFANGFLDNEEMRKYQEELREFSRFLERTVIVK